MGDVNLAEISQRLVWRNDEPVNASELNFSIEGRRLLHVGNLQMLPGLRGCKGIGSHRTDLIQVFALLCNDIMLLTQHKPGSDKLVVLAQPLDLGQCAVAHIFYNDDNEFMVEETTISEKNAVEVISYVFRTRSPKEKKIWVKHIHDCNSVLNGKEPMNGDLTQEKLLQERKSTFSRMREDGSDPYLDERLVLPKQRAVQLSNPDLSARSNPNSPALQRRGASSTTLVDRGRMATDSSLSRGQSQASLNKTPSPLSSRSPSLTRKPAATQASMGVSSQRPPRHLGAGRSQVSVDGKALPKASPIQQRSQSQLHLDEEELDTKASFPRVDPLQRRAKSVSPKTSSDTKGNEFGGQSSDKDASSPEQRVQDVFKGPMRSRFDEIRSSRDDNCDSPLLAELAEKMNRSSCESLASRTDASSSSSSSSSHRPSMTANSDSEREAVLLPEDMDLQFGLPHLPYRRGGKVDKKHKKESAAAHDKRESIGAFEPMDYFEDNMFDNLPASDRRTTSANTYVASPPRERRMTMDINTQPEELRELVNELVYVSEDGLQDVSPAHLTLPKRGSNLPMNTMSWDYGDEIKIHSDLFDMPDSLDEDPRPNPLRRESSLPNFLLSPVSEKSAFEILGESPHRMPDVAEEVSEGIEEKEDLLRGGAAADGEFFEAGEVEMEWSSTRSSVDKGRQLSDLTLPLPPPPPLTEITAEGQSDRRRSSAASFSFNAVNNSIIPALVTAPALSVKENVPLSTSQVDISRIAAGHIAADRVSHEDTAAAAAAEDSEEKALEKELEGELDGLSPREILKAEGGGKKRSNSIKKSVKNLLSFRSRKKQLADDRDAEKPYSPLPTSTTKIANIATRDLLDDAVAKQAAKKAKEVRPGLKTNTFYQELNRTEQEKPKDSTLGAFLMNNWEKIMHQPPVSAEEERRILETNHHQAVGAAVHSGVEAGKRLLSRLRDQQQQTWGTSRSPGRDSPSAARLQISRTDSSKAIWTGDMQQDVYGSLSQSKRAISTPQSKCGPWDLKPNPPQAEMVKKDSAEELYGNPSGQAAAFARRQSEDLDMLPRRVPLASCLGSLSFLQLRMLSVYHAALMEHNETANL